jgi:hypothetical protein
MGLGNIIILSLSLYSSMNLGSLDLPATTDTAAALASCQAQPHGTLEILIFEASLFLKALC